MRKVIMTVVLLIVCTGNALETLADTEQKITTDEYYKAVGLIYVNLIDLTSGLQLTEESKPGESGESKSGESKPGESEPGESKPGESEPGESKPGESKPGKSKPGESKPGESKPGESKPGKSKHKVLAAQRLSFEVMSIISIDPNSGKIIHDNVESGVAYRLIKFPEISSSDPYKGNKAFVNMNNWQFYYAIPEARFNELLRQGVIVKRFRLNCWPDVRFGAALTLPFKFRRKSDEHNREITTDVTLGGFVGLRWRVSRKHQYFASIIGTTGLTLLPINQGTTADSGVEGSTTVPALTVSGGVILELDSFQLGVMTGKDYASGSLGNNWIYNTEWWSSLSIGFTFIGGNT